MRRFGLVVLIVILVTSCASSDSIVSGGDLRIGQSKLSVKDPFILSSLDEDPFLCRCGEFFEAESVEILRNRNKSLYLVFENVTEKQRDYDDNKLGNGRLAGYFYTYTEAYAVVEAKRQENEDAIAAQRAEEKRVAETLAVKKREEEAAKKREQERQKQLRIAREKEAADKRRKALLAMKPISCNQLIAAVNANEARARRDYPQRETRVKGVVTDVNVTTRSAQNWLGNYYQEEIAQVSMRETEDLLNGCVANMKSFDDAFELDKGESFDFLCRSWDESMGNVSFDGCQLFKKVVK